VGALGALHGHLASLASPVHLTTRRAGTTAGWNWWTRWPVGGGPWEAWTGGWSGSSWTSAPAEAGACTSAVRRRADRRTVTGLLHQVLLTIPAATAGIMVVLLGTAAAPQGDRDGQPVPALRLQPPGVCAALALRVLVLIFRADR
jgi:hypothetical protein